MRKTIITFFGVTIAVLALWAYWPRIISKLQVTSDTNILQTQGQFGDSYGSLNTLFTGLAFIGVAGSILIQLHESKKRDAEVRRDAFESRFFHLNDALRSVVSDIVAREKKRHYSMREFQTTETIREGKDAFELFVKDLDKRTGAKLATAVDDAKRLEIILEAYYLTYDQFQDDLGPYFRMLYRIFRFIEKAPSHEMEEYAKIVRAELSGSELCIIAINGLTEYGENFKPLIERYDLLKHYPGTASIAKKIFENSYRKAG